MPDDSELANIDIWRTRLGLLPIPLFVEEQQGQAFVLLNGAQGNFCLDFGRAETDRDTRNYAWSSNVNHYVVLSNSHVEVQRWDRKGSSLERYTIKSVTENLENFHSYLENDIPSQGLSVISHIIQAYRSLRTLLGTGADGPQSLKAFLFLLACMTDRVDRRNLVLDRWGLGPDSAQFANSIRDADWDALQEELARGRQVESLVPELSLVLRHASGQLFQEAHYEALFIPQSQLMLGGFLPTPAKVTRETKGVGLHFTPPALARTLVEESLRAYGNLPETLVIFDPACGSGEFLRETLRQLRLRSYTGQINLIGWDISEAACDMATFVLAWEARGIEPSVTVSIHRTDSLNPDNEWPLSAHIILMNPPFVSWEFMDPAQKEKLSSSLGSIFSGRPDLSHAFAWKAANSLSESGVLGTILPASFLDGKSSGKLREQIGEILSPKLLARLGSQSLFSNVTVDAAFYVGKKSAPSGEDPLAFWSDYRSSSNSAGLRALRKMRYPETNSVIPVLGDGYSIYLNKALGRGSGSWAPRPYQSLDLAQRVSQLPRVEELFNIRQGIRTGFNKAFLLTVSQWNALPKTEQRLFRPAVINSSIDQGVLAESAYVFYPYGVNEIGSESELKKVARRYYMTFLLPNKNSLVERPKINPNDWWKLTWHRTWQLSPMPKLVSTSFGDSGSFAWDRKGNFVVVQGWAWLPKQGKAKKFGPNLGLAYLAILSSKTFSTLLSATSNHVGGGQWDLSNKFIRTIAIPDLFSSQFSEAILIHLWEFGKQISEGRPIDPSALQELVEQAYGIRQSF